MSIKTRASRNTLYLVFDLISLVQVVLYTTLHRNFFTRFGIPKLQRDFQPPFLFKVCVIYKHFHDVKICWTHWIFTVVASLIYNLVHVFVCHSRPRDMKWKRGTFANTCSAFVLLLLLIFSVLWQFYLLLLNKFSYLGWS